MRRDQSLKLQLVDCFEKPICLADVFIDITFFKRDRLCYAFRFGPTDSLGQICIAFDDVESKRQIAAKYNLMDYNTPLTECDERVSVKVPSGDELREAYEWQKLYPMTSDSPINKLWLNAANKVIKVDEKYFNLKSTETFVQLQCKK